MVYCRWKTWQDNYRTLCQGSCPHFNQITSIRQFQKNKETFMFLSCCFCRCFFVVVEPQQTPLLHFLISFWEEDRRRRRGIDWVEIFCWCLINKIGKTINSDPTNLRRIWTTKKRHELLSTEVMTWAETAEREIYSFFFSMGAFKWLTGWRPIATS